MACCGTRYYCTADGPVGVEPDADGWYAVPEGGTSGWYRTYEEAVTDGGCSPPPEELLCDGCETPYVVPDDVVTSLVNMTGNLDEIFENSVALESGTSVGFWQYGYSIPGSPSKLVNYSLSATCEEDGSLTLRLIIFMFMDGSPPTPTYINGLTSSTGWAGVFAGAGGTSYVWKTYACGETPNFNEHVGLVEFQGVNYSGEADVYLVS